MRAVRWHQRNQSNWDICSLSQNIVRFGLSVESYSFCPFISVTYISINDIIMIIGATLVPNGAVLQCMICCLTDDQDGWETVHRNSRSRTRPQSAGSGRNGGHHLQKEVLKRHVGGGASHAPHYQRTMSDGHVKKNGKQSVTLGKVVFHILFFEAKVSESSLNYMQSL